jgi:alpha-tubulin suppressor-like RCC1 family protein
MSCYTTAACNTETDQIVVQALPMLVAIPGSGGKDDATSHAVGVSCGSRHTVILTKANVLWAFGWNKYGQVSSFPTYYFISSNSFFLVIR